MNNLFSIYAFPNMYDIFPYKYTQEELNDFHKKNTLFFSHAVFPVIKHRWKKAFVCLQDDVYMLNVEINGDKPYKKINYKDISNFVPTKTNFKNNTYKTNYGPLITFECFSYIKCSFYTNISEITLDDKRGLLIAGNKLSIFSSKKKAKEESSIGILGNQQPFHKIRLASLHLETQLHMFDLLKQKKTIIITGSTGIGKTSQLPKLIMWYNYLFGGWCNLEKINFYYNSKPVVLSLPRVTLVKSNGSTLLHSLGFVSYDNSPVELKYGGLMEKTKRLQDGIVLSTNKLTSYSLFSYNIVIIDEIHEHDKIADISIAVLRKHMDKIHCLVLMSATLEDDKDRLLEFFPNACFYHISGTVRYPINEIYIKNSFEKLTLNYFKQEMKNVSKVMKWCKPSREACGILFLPSVSECIKYKKYLDIHNSELEHIIIHGKVKDAASIIEYAQKTNRNKPCILVSTPYLESSITVSTATHVYDTGRVYLPKPFGGENTFISKSMMTQRKGRVGRVSKGTYVYFYNQNLLRSIKKIDYEFLYEYIIYAEQFCLKLPEDLLVIPKDLNMLKKTKEYIKSFGISFEKLFFIYTNYFVNMVEYVKIYNKGGEKSYNLDLFERYDILTDETIQDIKDLKLLVKIKSVSKHKNLYVYKGEILFGPYIHSDVKFSSKQFHKNYVYALTDKCFI